jgi:peptidoglycan/LPS O-acetylase OafA/YrhL
MDHSRRLAQFDGLRGLAALVVVVCHAVAILPGIGDIFTNRRAPLGEIERLFVYTPLHVLWNGTAAVSVFFVLSGFVLVLPFLRSQAYSVWVGYFPRRLLRLYVPVWGAVVLAAVIALAAPRVSLAGASDWAMQYAAPPTLGSIGRGAVLLLGGTELNPPLWSLRWEIVFSVALPAYVVFVRYLQRWWWLKVFVCLGIVAIGGVFYIDALIYLPIFALGSLLAVRREALSVIRLGGRWWALISVVALLLLNSEWVTPQEIPGFEALVGAGAAIIVWVFLAWPVAAGIGRRTVSQFLGRISFSLYLVHVPVLFLAVAVLAPSVSLTGAIGLGFVASFIAAIAFYMVVEKPAHRFSIYVGKRLADAAEGGSITRKRGSTD